MNHFSEIAQPDGTASGLLSVLRLAYSQRITGILTFTTLYAPGTVEFFNGNIRSVAFHDRQGLAALTALALLVKGPVTLQALESSERRFGDQFGLMTPVIFDLLATTTARFRDSGLRIDPVLGTPVPVEGTTVNQLLHEAKVTLRPSVTTESVPDGDFPEDFIGGLVSDDMREGELVQKEDVLAIPPWEPPALGQMVGRCYLSGRIGEGASAIVYQALHIALKIDVAIKIFRPLPDGSGTTHPLSLIEGQMLARLSHQNIVRVLDASDAEPYPFVVMEFVDGANLGELIARTGRIPPESVIGMLLQVAAGLAHAHAAGVTHCDIKPGNILVDNQQVVKLTDLGVARMKIHEGGSKSRQIIGTPAYIAPEVVQDGIGAATAASDIYALGATAFHALTGRLPFDEADPLLMMVKHVQADPPLASSKVHGLPPALDQLIAKMLSRQPLQRPTAAEMIITLTRMQVLSVEYGPQRRGQLPQQIFLTMGRAWRDIRSALDQLLGRR